MQIAADSYTIEVSGDTESFQIRLTLQVLSEGLQLVHVRMESLTAEKPPSIKLSWAQPAIDIRGVWDTDAGRRDNFIGTSFTSKSTSQAPVVSLYNMHGENRQTFAFSDALHAHKVVSWIDEYTACYNCSLTLFTEPSAPITHYEATLRLDTRNIPYYQCLQEVSLWWESQPGYQASAVPESAYLPVYSTWYSFHQDITETAIEVQCKLANELGCKVVIVDDGWQTATSGTAYASCGDWHVSKERIRDMRAHVSRVQSMGMKYMLWYSVPFIGKASEAWPQFANKLLGFNEGFQAATLDPRFPDVREYLIRKYETAVTEWNLDGLKLDFVDYFRLAPDKENELGQGRDYDSIPVAVDRLLTDTAQRLRQLKPDIMIEFRQTYIGPLMRKYGNMFRVADCPNDLIMNRVNTIDLRMLSGHTAVHADMMMWHPAETPHGAALQLIHTLFAVPQISMLLHQVPKSHLKMIRFWLSFWCENRDLLLCGNLVPERPDMLYPVVWAKNESVCLAAVYADYVVRLEGEAPQLLMLVNGTSVGLVVVKLAVAIGARMLKAYNCEGTLVYERTFAGEAGLHEFKVPPSGVLRLEREK